MYESPSHLILGFHGCDKSVGEKILSGRAVLLPSENEYDWLGSGRYFWENSPTRALEYAGWLSKIKPSKSKARIRMPFVIGAILDLGHCLNLLEQRNLNQLQESYKTLLSISVESGRAMPQNQPLRGSEDLILRYLDRAVIEMVHENKKENGLPSYDSVRGVFWEGKELYPNAGFREQNHIQICVRNPDCIKGYFRVLSK